MTAARELSKVVGHLRGILESQQSAGATDAELLQRYVQQRDDAAFGALVRRHGAMVLGVCRRVLHNWHDAEDAYQATFLVLVRKASTLRSPSMIGNWLYGVAYRTALHARQAAVKRRAKEAKVVLRTEVPEDTWTDLRLVLDQELEQLPDKYRAVIVLCDLEGKTRKEAARHLGWAEGTVASRLTRGRTMLAKRLARHGLTISGGALAVLLSENASACVPAFLSSFTIKAASLFAAGKAATVLRPELVALTREVLKAMLYTRLKVVALVMLVTATLGGGATLATFPARADPPRESQSAERPTGPDGGAKVGPESKPAVGGVASACARKPRLVDAGASVEALDWCPPDGKLMATQVKNWSPTAAGSAVVTGCALQIRDGETGAIRRTLYDESNVWDVAFSPDGKSVAAALDGENVVKLWDPWTGKEQKTFDAKIDGDLDKISANLTKVAFSRDGRLLAAAGRIRNLVIGEWKAIVILWEIGSGKLLWQVQDHTHKIDAWIDALVFSPDGKLLATGSRQDATTKLRDTATGQCKQTIQFPEGGSAWSLAFSPDGKQLASGGMDGRVCLWDADSGKLKLVLTNGYLRGQLVVAFSPDGKWVAAGGTTLGTKDNGCCGDVRLFDAKTGKFDRAFHDILGTGVRALAFSPGGETLAVGNWMKQILLLPIQKDPAR